jgi:hypothetical protein
VVDLICSFTLVLFPFCSPVLFHDIYIFASIFYNFVLRLKFDVFIRASIMLYSMIPIFLFLKYHFFCFMSRFNLFLRASLVIFFYCSYIFIPHILQFYYVFRFDLFHRTTLIPYCHVLPPFQNIRCFRFVKQMYLDTF